MQTVFYEVKPIGRGRLFVMPRPNAERLADEMVAYMTAGLNKIVCLMETEEIMAQGLTFERHLCDQLGLDYQHFPIQDRRLPLRLKAFNQLVEALYQDLQHGKNVAIHCYAGIGRTGVLAGCLLIRDGMNPQEAIELMSKARGRNMPQTQDQYDFLLDWEPENSCDAASKEKSSWFKRLLMPA